MVVCKCRKATKLYCYVHKVPVCGDCICFQEHKLCVVRSYAEWVIDGDYEWPTKCTGCQQVLQEADSTCRLGCLHLLHVSCLEVQLKSFPSHTAPAGYVCPECFSSIWPPKNFKDVTTGLPAKLAELIVQSNLGATLLGNEAAVSIRVTPPAFSSDPLVSSLPLQSPSAIVQGNGNKESMHEIVDPSSMGSLHLADHFNGVPAGSGVDVPKTTPSGASPVSSTVVVPSMPQLTKKPYVGPQQHHLARKNSRGDKTTAESLSGDEHDHALRKKYSRRGPFYKRVLRGLLPFWSPALPTLPVTAPSRKDTVPEESLDGQPRRRHPRSSAIDPRRILLLFAIMSCIATMLLLYYRLLQNSGSRSVE